MTVPSDFADLERVSPGATRMESSGVTYVHLPRLRMPAAVGGCVVEALLRPGTGPDGYTTRLFLSAPFPQRGQNWTVHNLFGKAWHTPSFNNVPSDAPLIEILANHLAMYK